MGPIIVSIVYDRPVYHGGELLNGQVQVHLEKALQLSKIKVKAIGQCEVRWVKKATNDKDRDIIYKNSESYLNQSIVLYNKAHHEILGPGYYNYPFAILLPSPLPETFNTLFGNVSYFCKASVKTTESLFLKFKVIQPFKVHANVNVNSFGNVNEMATLHKTERLPLCCICCCCFSTGKITASLNLNKKGYIPGEEIIINAEISNRSTASLSFLQASLNQTVICIARCGAQKRINQEICQINCSNEMSPGADFVWQNAALKLPQIPPTNMGGCNIIKINYAVEINIGEDSGCCSPKVTHLIPIFIGSGMFTDIPFLIPGTSDFAPSCPPIIESQPAYNPQYTL